jgi:hypothetical protein
MSAEPDAPLPGAPINHPSRVDRGEWVGTTSKEERVASSQWPSSRPPIKPEVGPFPIMDLVASPQFRTDELNPWRGFIGLSSVRAN